MMSGFTETLVGFGFNLLAVILVIRFMYYPDNRDKSYVVTFFALNTVLYFVLRLLMAHGNFSIEIGFGLFAVFSILRYRSDPIPMREMTYLFVVIALPVVNAILGAEGAYAELLLADLLIVAILFAVEQEWGFAYEMRQIINYERVELIKPENRILLLQDLHKRTGLAVHRIEIRRIDLLRETAEIAVFYDAGSQNDARQPSFAGLLPPDGEYDELQPLR
jgi:hypothetical protein